MNSSLRADFDIRLDADGRIHTDVILASDHTYQTSSTVNYDVSIRQNGQVVFSDTGIDQYRNSNWHRTVISNGDDDPHVVFDVNYLVKTGAVPAYDTTLGVSNSATRFPAICPFKSHSAQSMPATAQSCP